MRRGIVNSMHGYNHDMPAMVVNQINASRMACCGSQDRLVEAPPHNRAVHYHHGPDRHFPSLERALRLGERDGHKLIELNHGGP